MSATATTTQFKTPFSVVDFAGRTLKVFGSKPAAIKFAVAQDAEYVSNDTTAKVVWANPEAKIEAEVGDATPAKAKRVYARATRATVQPENAITGRFELETYGSAGETKYANRPDATLRALLGIKWRELWALGYTQKESSRVLAAIDNGDVKADVLRAEALEALEIMEEDEA